MDLKGGQDARKMLSACKELINDSHRSDELKSKLMHTYTHNICVVE